MTKHQKSRIRVFSDLHIEGHPFVYQDGGEDAIILAGDIHTRDRVHELLDQIPQHKAIYFVAGNHEYYHGIFEDAKQYFRSLEAKYSNFTFLDNEQTEIGDVPVYGGTMFTDFQLYGVTDVFAAEQRARNGINDFRAIRRRDQNNDTRLWTPSDHKEEFVKYIDGLNVFLRRTDGAPFRIVISHFMPTEKCTAPQFIGSPLNPYFTANMEQYMGWDGLWIAGHGHNSVDVVVGGTRVVMNSQGYRYRTGIENPNFQPAFIVEV